MEELGKNNEKKSSIGIQNLLIIILMVVLVVMFVLLIIYIIFGLLDQAENKAKKQLKLYTIKFFTVEKIDKGVGRLKKKLPNKGDHVLREIFKKNVTKMYRIMCLYLGVVDGLKTNNEVEETTSGGKEDENASMMLKLGKPIELVDGWEPEDLPEDQKLPAQLKEILGRLDDLEGLGDWRKHEKEDWFKNMQKLYKFFPYVSFESKILPEHLMAETVFNVKRKFPDLFEVLQERLDVIYPLIISIVKKCSELSIKSIEDYNLCNQMLRILWAFEMDNKAIAAENQLSKNFQQNGFLDSNGHVVTLSVREDVEKNFAPLEEDSVE